MSKSDNIKLYNLHSKQTHKTQSKQKRKTETESDRDKAHSRVTVTIRKVTQSACKQRNRRRKREAVKLHNKTNNNYQRHCQGKKGTVAQPERERERGGREQARWSITNRQRGKKNFVVLLLFFDLFFVCQHEFSICPTPCAPPPPCCCCCCCPCPQLMPLLWHLASLTHTQTNRHTPTHTHRQTHTCSYVAASSSLTASGKCAFDIAMPVADGQQSCHFAISHNNSNKTNRNNNNMKNWHNNNNMKSWHNNHNSQADSARTIKCHNESFAAIEQSYTRRHLSPFSSCPLPLYGYTTCCCWH